MCITSHSGEFTMVFSQSKNGHSKADRTIRTFVTLYLTNSKED